MSKHLDGAEGFCANAKDVFYGSTYWRGKDKSPDDVKKDTKNKPLKEEIDCSDRNGNAKFTCKIQKLKSKIRDLKRDKANTEDQDKKDDIDYKIDAIIDMIDAEEEKRDAQQDLDKIKDND